MPAVPVREALNEVWSIGGGEPAALDRVALTGAEPALPGAFAVGTMAQATIAASALAAAEVWRARGGAPQTVSVDMQHAAVEFRSERYMRVPDVEHRGWDTVAGLYKTADGRHVRLHTNFPHHRAGMLKLLGAEYTRESVAAKLQGWQGEVFETAAAQAGLVATMTRTPAEWAAHGQGKAVAGLPLFEVIKIGEARPRPITTGARPLSGIRALDLTRVIAGPVCGRTLAAHGADVLQISSPHLPSMAQLVMDTGRGKRAAFLDLENEGDRETLRALAGTGDVFVQGYRPGAIARHGFAPEQLAERLRQPRAERQWIEYRRSGGRRDRRWSPEGAGGPGPRPRVRIPDGHRRDDGAEATAGGGRVVAGARLTRPDRPLVLAARSPRGGRPSRP
jgi:crotonobetainyl-CoA:carnitine CoA-transferase CaiB-like acyl-CoA transferase